MKMPSSFHPIALGRYVFLLGVLSASACGMLIGVGDADDFRIADSASTSASSGTIGSSGNGQGGQGQGGNVGSQPSALECVASLRLPADVKTAEVTGVTIDGAGEVVLVGNFRNPIDFGGGTITPQGVQDIFAVKYSTLLLHRWSKGIGSLKRDDAGPVVSTGEHVYIGGGFYDDFLQIDGESISDAGKTDGTSDPFVVSLASSTGTAEWIQYCGEAPWNSAGVCASLSLDSSGNIYSAALMNGQTYAASSVINAQGSNNNPSNFLSSSAGLESVHTLWMNDALFRAGSFNLSIDFDGSGSCQQDTLTNFASDIYFSRSPASCFDCLSCLAQSVFFTRGDGFSQTVAQMAGDDGAVSGDSGVFLAGTLYGSISEWSGGTFSSQGEGDAYLIKLDPVTGDERWSHLYGDLQMQRGKAVRTFGGNVALAGDFRGQIDLSPDQSKPWQASQRDVFLGVFDSKSGAVKLGTFWENTGNQSVTAMDVNASGDIVLVGEFDGSADFGCASGPLQSVGQFPNIFVVRFKWTG